MSTFKTEVLPYLTCDDALSNCGIDTGLDSEQRVSANSWNIRSSDIEGGFSPKLKLDVDWDQLTETTNVDESDLKLSVRLKNANARMFKILESWDAGSEGDEWSPQKPIFTGTNFEIVLTAHVIRNLSQTVRGIRWPGSIVASKTFGFSEGRGYRFPVSYGNFVSRGWPSDALIHIDLDPEGIDNAPEDCLRVTLNEDLRGLFESTRRESKMAREIFARICGAMIFTDVSREAMTYISEGSEELSGLSKIIVDTLTNSRGFSIKELQQLAEKNSNEFEMHAHNSLRLSSELSRYIR